MPIDLHVHSTASDGTQPPAQVVASAASAGLDVLALTDHDTTAGWQEAAQAAREHGVALVRGVEISCQHGGISIHLLGYLHDPDAPLLLAELTRSRESRETRARRMVDLLAVDLPLTYDDVLERAGSGATIGRPHIADALVHKRLVASRTEAFDRYLFSGSPYHTTHYAPDPVTAISLVTASGGVAVMAHPFAHLRGRTVDEEVIEEMAGAGLAGLEVHHRDHDAVAVAHGLRLARRLHLLVTGSSDYHGTGKPNRLGENTTTPRVLHEIEERSTGVPVVRD